MESEVVVDSQNLLVTRSCSLSPSLSLCSVLSHALTHPHTHSFTHTYKGALTGLALKTHFEISQMRNVLFFGNEIHNLTFFSSPTNQKPKF